MKKLAEVTESIRGRTGLRPSGSNHDSHMPLKYKDLG